MPDWLGRASLPKPSNAYLYIQPPSPPRMPIHAAVAGRKRQRVGQLVPSAVGGVQLAAADLAAAAEQTALQLLLQHLARQNAAKPPSMFTIGVQVTNHPAIKAAMAAMAAGQLTPTRSCMSAAGSMLRAYADGHGAIELPPAMTGLQLQLPDRWRSAVQSLVPRLSAASPGSRHARDARLQAALGDAPQLLLEGADAQHQNANGNRTALVGYDGTATTRQQLTGWHSGESDTESEYNPEETLAVAAGTVADGYGTLQLMASAATAVVVSEASVGSNGVATVSSDVRLTGLTAALVPADGATAAAVALQLPPVSLLTWNIWGAVCAFRAASVDNMHVERSLCTHAQCWSCLQHGGSVGSLQRLDVIAKHKALFRGRLGGQMLVPPHGPACCRRRT